MRGSGRIDGSVRNLLFVGGRQTRLRTVPVHGLFHVFSSFSTPPTSSDFQRFSRFPFFRAVLLTHALFKRETKLSKLVLLLSSFERPWVRTRCGGTHPNENRRRPSGTRPFEVPPVSEGDRTTKTLPRGLRPPTGDAPFVVFASTDVRLRMLGNACRRRERSRRGDHVSALFGPGNVGRFGGIRFARSPLLKGCT